LKAVRFPVRALAAAALVVVATRAAAHEVRPAYLELSETARGRFDVVWKVPTRGGGVPLAGEDVPHAGSAPEAVDAGEPRTMPCGCPAPTASDTAFGALPVHAVLPAGWRAVTPLRLEQLPGAAIRRWTVVTGEAGIEGAAVAAHGLDVAVIDVLVRVALADGRVVSQVLRPGASSFTVRMGETIPVLGYLRLGVEHILFGIDHLLFVLGLILLVGGLRLLVKTITAFTLAHSITLGLAMLGVVHVPQAPVEAVIALSIVFLAAELVRQSRGETGLTARQPWLVAFVFGLLHGLGFAGALSEVGLPPGDVPAALLLFNVGVEVGQLAFVVAVLALIRTVRSLPAPAWRWLDGVPAYAIGSIATFWVVQRIAGF
jgi:hydrogenase/urease accessory protein HupE